MNDIKAGQANWPPSTVDPAKGYMYVCAGERQAAYSTQTDTDLASSGDRYMEVLCDLRPSLQLVSLQQ